MNAMRHRSASRAKSRKLDNPTVVPERFLPKENKHSAIFFGKTQARTRGLRRSG